ncbi:hypothetical protein GU926_11920 [Nibribacter ruber]|uniref:Uncharacterized protein n=1 Tax=Nibribacter ruber TaxID=2698458 RepID=A0A6P1NYI0_9BACT|nr:hypothetical protein [Nibribacter ruber]QHL88100.1 hypothetical protein GU926_11920 [Nibribacter ruber]
MRYLYSAVLAFGVLVSCQTKTETSTQESPVVEENQVPAASTPMLKKPFGYNPLLVEYEQFLAQLDSGKVENVSVAAAKFDALFKGQPTALADSGYVLFDRFYLRTDNTLNEKHDFVRFDSLLINHSLSQSLKQSKEIKAYEMLLKSNGFQLAMSEGMTYLQQDRDFITKHFYPYTGPALKEYLTQLNKENKEGFQEDGGLSISPTQLADRVIWWESFIKRNPGFVLLQEADEERRGYLGTLLNGMDNSPVLSFDNHRLDDYYATAYKHLENKAPSSDANKLVKPVYQALLKNDTAQANSLVRKYMKAGLLY